MTFWSDIKLRENLNKVISPADQTKVDISGYRLSVGEKIFITKDIDKNSEPTSVSLMIESYREIPSGQFALISTQEKVTVPKNSIGFISMRAKTKFKGLINVSGFHVDPGYSDHLVFSVFNAGPKPIPIQKGDDIFLIWFADLDQENEKSKGNCGLNGAIPSHFISDLNLQVDSAAGLAKNFRSIQDKLDLAKAWGLFLAGLLIAFLTWVLSTINNLDVQSKIFESNIEVSSKLDEDLRDQLQSLKLKVADQSAALTNSTSDYDAQKKIFIEVNKRLESIEEKLKPNISKK
jgi:dCTP deaminase